MDVVCIFHGLKDLLNLCNLAGIFSQLQRSQNLEDQDVGETSKGEMADADVYYRSSPLQYLQMLRVSPFLLFLKRDSCFLVVQDQAL